MFSTTNLKQENYFGQNIILHSCALESITGSTDSFLLYGTVFKMRCRCFLYIFLWQFVMYTCVIYKDVSSDSTVLDTFCDTLQNNANYITVPC